MTDATANDAHLSTRESPLHVLPSENGRCTVASNEFIYKLAAQLGGQLADTVGKSLNYMTSEPYSH